MSLALTFVHWLLDGKSDLHPVKGRNGASEPYRGSDEVCVCRNTGAMTM